MAAKNHKQWMRNPNLADNEWIDSRMYSDQNIHDQEQENIFSKVWIPICHESEFTEMGDYKNLKIAGVKVLVINHVDGSIRAFRDTHTSDMDFTAAELEKRRLHLEIKFGGFVWITLDENPPISLEAWAGKPFECLRKTLDEEPLEIFHYHKAIIDTNYKLWHDTNSEFYHDFMHYHNRVTGFNDAYFARKNEAFEYGHVVVGTFEVNYENYKGFQSRGELSFPHLPPNQWYMIDLFPGFNFNLRGSALRCDIVTPLAPDKVLIEFRGLGLKSDTEEERLTRIDHHNSIWGPFGRNLHEDLIGVAGQGTTMRQGTEKRRILHGRRENQTIHDENGMRHYYDEWGKWMDILPRNVDEKYFETLDKLNTNVI